MLLANAPCSFERPDGVWEHHIRQSDIGTFRKCPELHRRSVLGLVPDVEGDAALIGTAAHAGASAAIDSIMDGIAPDFMQCAALVEATLDAGWHGGNLRQVQIRDYGTAVELADQCFRAWWGTFLDDLDPDLIASCEERFDVVAWREPRRIVYLTGTMDLRFNDCSVVDWKFPGDLYSGRNGWKHQRYDQQPTHYLWASLLLSGANPLLDPERDKPLPDFTYGVVQRGTSIAEEFEIKRTIGDIRFYKDEILTLCSLIEQRLDRWPLNPTDWWCSDKWCPAWDQCRGMHMPTDPFGLMAKVADTIGVRVSPIRLVDPIEEGDDSHIDPYGDTA